MAPKKDIPLWIPDEVPVKRLMKTKIVETRVVMSPMEGQERYPIKQQHADIEIIFKNGQKMKIGKGTDSDYQSTHDPKGTFMNVEIIDNLNSEYHFRYRPNPENQITLKKLLKCAKKQDYYSFKDSNCQHAAIKLFNESTGLKETDIPQQYWLDLFSLIKIKYKKFEYAPKITIGLEITKKSIKALCKIPQTRAIAGNAVRSFLVTCVKSKSIDEAYHAAIQTTKQSVPNVFTSSIVAKSGKYIYQVLEKKFNGGNKFLHKACGTGLAAALRPFLMKLLYRENYSMGDAINDWSLETFTQSMVYLIQKFYGITTRSNYLVSAVFVIIPQLWDIINKIRKGEEIDWWALISSLTIAALSFTGWSWWIVWILGPLIVEMIRELVGALQQWCNSK